MKNIYLERLIALQNIQLVFFNRGSSEPGE